MSKNKIIRNIENTWKDVEHVITCPEFHETATVTLTYYTHAGRPGFDVGLVDDYKGVSHCTAGNCGRFICPALTQYSTHS